MRTVSRQDGKLAAAILLIAGGLPALATLLGLAGRWHWTLDLLSHFRVQYLLVLMLIVLLSLMTRRRRVAAVLALPLAINFGLVAPLYLSPASGADRHRGQAIASSEPAAEPRPTSSDVPMRIVLFNINVHNPRAEQVVDYLAELEADVLVLQEVTPRWLDEYQFRMGEWNLRYSQPRDDSFGLAVFHRFSIEKDAPRVRDVQPISLTEEGMPPIPAVEAEVAWAGQTVRMLCVHAMPPHNARAASWRDAQLNAAAEWARAQKGPAVIVGDFNATPWSYAFNDLLESSGMLNSQFGFGVQGTWPAGGGPLGKIPIDHLLHTADLVTRNRTLGPGLGSDHHPLIVTLAWSR